MTEINITTNNPYPAKIGNGASDALAELLRARHPSKIAVISDDNVTALYREKLEALLKETGHTIYWFSFAAGENSKTLATLSAIYDFLAGNDFTRADMLIAFGGGIPGDVTGFAAGTFLRGIDFVQLPTTLLAMIDSSVGGKTAVNLPYGKNLVGCFHQPIAVFCDTDYLKTLPACEMQNGMGEAIKHGAIANKELFRFLAEHPIQEHLEYVITENLKIKNRFVTEDTFDKGARQMLNFGHTLGHGIEKHSGYRVNHGTAVALGMVLITEFSTKAGITQDDSLTLLKQVLKTNHLPVDYPLSFPELLVEARNDKKRSGKSITLVLLESIGHAVLKTFDYEQLLQESRL